MKPLKNRTKSAKPFSTDNNEKTASFFETVQALPQPLGQRFIKQIMVAAAIFALTIILMIVTKELSYCCGFLFALYMSYLACSLIWKVQGKTIYKAKMICLKAKKMSMQRILLVLKEYGEAASLEEHTHKFYIPATKKDLALITEKTILEIYFDSKSPTELLAWEILGVSSEEK